MTRHALILAMVVAVVSQRVSAFTSRHVRPAISSSLFSSISTTTTATTSPFPIVAEPSIVLSRVFATDKRPVILFDGVCNMCNGAVNLALDYDPDAKLRFSALQSNVGRALLQTNGRDADDISSIVLVTSDGAFIKSDAILRITEELTPSWLPLPLAKPAARAGRALVPKFLRDLIYDGVADNRYSILGMRDECRFGDENEFTARFVDDSIAAA
uniref:Thiol-disulfide oxidoreductase DCC n=1 Tax=Minutocellus polymorphus TaxID=265543 RepID=A0A7S0AWY2_9STRA|eukprot:CAMPEP_0197716676 /NCGR_PEP_ID=MMETSP1434-20131217/1478_1 /TAXON_ID=265543 /ORGANISM="Minutocellus polymorphus, Strain CCMP3303" /LENGTH=213 /DNA_ID=CAMNT_0043301071 /DNA_START=64 /DNA_END=705 /DNA_ORIENTATION=+